MILSDIPLNEFYRELDWPAVPDHICEYLIDYVNTSPMNIREGVKPNDDDYFSMHKMPDLFYNWYNENLSFIPKDYLVRIQKIPLRVLTPHIDFLRKCSYNFVLTNDNSTTYWHNNQNKTVCSVNYDSRKWYQHQGSISHSVHNPTDTPRIAITIYKFNFYKQQWNMDFMGNRHDTEQVDEYLKMKRNR